MPQERIERTYNINQRILAEETALEAASLVVASTRQEVEEQYSDYNNFKPSASRVVPPGVDLKAFEGHTGVTARPPIVEEMNRFLRDPKKPMVLALARPDERKNLTGLIEAYALNEDLRRKANLVIVAGNRDDISSMDSGPRGVIEKILFLIDKCDLYGQVAYPKHHLQTEVADIYLTAARTGGVFVNSALTEPFGLTLIESAACGLPVAATNDGGPRDILENCRNGVLINPLDPEEMGRDILSVISDRKTWKRYSMNGLKGARKHYSWENHVALYLDSIRKKISRRRPQAPASIKKNRLASMNRLIITDIDNTLLGDKTAVQEMMAAIKQAPVRIGFGVATGRHLSSALKVLTEWGVGLPDILITSVGTEIYSGPNLILDDAWERYINHKWRPEEIRRIAARIPGLVMQPEENQRPFKISYDTSGPEFPGPDHVRKLLKNEKTAASVIFSHDKHLDFLPIRASKGKALKHLAVKWGILLDNILTAGDSGNDREMLLAGPPAVVVGNYSHELASLKKKSKIYFARQKYAAGIMEGMEHFRFLQPLSDD